MKLIAMMYKLDWRGRIVDTIHVEYHTCHWGNYCSLGYITVQTYEVGENQ